LILLFQAVFCFSQTKRALLIGINTYQPEGTTAHHPAGCVYGRCELGSFQNLEGAVNDAQSMADLLTSPKFGFPASQVVLLTNPAPPQPRTGVVILPPGQTDRDGILAAMRRYLVDVPQHGDTVVFYDASHGSLRVNSKGNKITVLVHGAYVHADSTLVPSDAYKGGFDIRDREMTRIFQAALDKGVHLTAIFDSCHSGGTTRGGDLSYRGRALAFDPRDIGELPEALPNGSSRLAPTEREDNPALVFSAAQQDQEAEEAEPTLARPESHGAFTAALIEALEALPADAPATLVYQRVKAVLEGGGAREQEPDLDATAARRQQPLFGGLSSTDTRKVRAAALKMDAEGHVWLDVGRVSGVGVGSEFVSARRDGRGDAVRLRIAELRGIARSTATIVTPAGAKVASGQVFELAKWVPAEAEPLRFWNWPANLSEAEILAAATEVKNSGIILVGDPADEPWTDMLFWDGTNWMLRHATPVKGSAASGAIDPDQRADAVVPLGSKLSAEVLKQHLPAGARLWVNLPPSRGLAARIEQHESHSAVQAAGDRVNANYLLTGRLSNDGIAYAWFDRQEFDAGLPAEAALDHSPGCSEKSQYPTRSDWVGFYGAGGNEEGVAALTRYASLLAKVHGWLQLADNPASASGAPYYKLAMVNVPNHAALVAGQPVVEGERLQMEMKADGPVTERRWVYVLDIDCHGKGTLLYPHDLGENQFPSNADRGREFVLPGSPTLLIGPPYGVDTLLMLSTAQPLPDPYALDFEGVATRGNSEPLPLVRLLMDASQGTRGETGPVPTDWALEVHTLRSIPGDAAQRRSRGAL
jgi:hypothetical protein